MKAGLSQSHKAHNSFLRRWLTAASLVAILTAGLAGCVEETEKVEAPAPVRVATVAMQPAAETRRYVGVIRPRYESDLGFRVAGKIIERAVNVGDRVKAGAIIARLDATDSRLSLEAQEAELAAAKSSRDQAGAAEKRFEILKAKGHVSEAAFDERQAAADEARSRVERAERALEVQRNQVAYTELRADRDGVVSALPVEEGQVVAAGQFVARVARLDELEAVVAIPEQNLGEASAARAAIELWPASGKTYPAKLREVSPEADRDARTFATRFSIAQPDENVALGKTAAVILSRDETKALARLPLSAVMNDAKGPMVWVVDRSGAKLERRAVVLDSFAQDAALVASGLNAGERVVTLGVHALDEKKPVRVIEERTALR